VPSAAADGTALRVHGFGPVANTSSRLLILGSMPGKASLRAGQYYAHPRNAFWRIMGELFGIDPSASYDERIAGLLASRIALWDVLASCTREGSLDSDIDDASLVVNPLAAFLRAHPGIRTVCFNGAKAESCYRKHVLADALREDHPIAYHRLPSTSPANAALAHARKLAAWRAACAGAGSGRAAQSRIAGSTSTPQGQWSDPRTFGRTKAPRT
jgi:TDG/mug DNA glycosylase family protein